MQTQPDRQQHILRLMGVDIWQLRQSQPSPVEYPAAELDSPATSDGERVSSATLEWVASGAGNPDADFLFVCQCDLPRYGDRLASGSARCQLYEAILFSLGLCPEDVYTMSVVRQEVAGVDQELLTPSLENFFTRHQPQTIVVMGEQCARALVKAEKPLAVLRTEKYRYPGSECMLLATFSLDWLLDHPQDKAVLWQDLLRISAPTHKD